MPLASFLVSHGTIENLIGTYGYIAVLAFVGIESLGVPFPGESALIAASVYAGATHRLAIAGVVAAAAAGAIIGDNIGFLLGRWGGTRLLERYGKYVRIDERRMRIGRYIFMRHGGKVVFFGRFVSVLRTYAAFLAGTNLMHWRRFLAFNAAGGVIWAAIYGFGYYYLGGVFAHLSTTADIALGVAGAAVVVGFVLFLRQNERRLAREADRHFGIEAGASDPS
jgi:membrane protein DedA with SNARE-associated domain